MSIKPETPKIVEEFVLELWWADEVSASRLENLLFNLVISVIDSCSDWCDFDMEDLAAKAGLSRAHFFSLLHRQYLAITSTDYRRVVNLYEPRAEDGPLEPLI
jgi:AraC family transcriptional regulator